MADTFQAQITRTATVIGRRKTGVYAADEGIVASNTLDQRAALATLAAKYTSTTTKTRIYLPPGIVRGGLPMRAGVQWVLCGTDILPSPGGHAGHLVYPSNPAWLGTTQNGGANAGAGDHFFGITGDGSIDGEMDSWPAQHACPTPPTPAAVNGTGGTLTAGDYSYRIAYKTSFGISHAGDPVMAWGVAANGKVTLTWTNPSGLVTGAQPVIYGRSAWVRTQQQELATLAAGTTTWTDTGAATPSGPWWRTVDLSAPSVLLIGAGYSIDGGGITFRNVPGSFYSEWLGSSIAGMPWQTGMEARIRALRLEKFGGNAVFQGPHDSTIDVMTASYLCAQNGAGMDGVVFDDYGPWRVSRLHPWGTMRDAISVRGPVTLTDCQGEGGRRWQLNLANDEATVVGGDYFPGGSPTASTGGIKVSAKNRVIAPSLRGFSSATGPAIDLTTMGAGSQVTAMAIDQSSGTVAAAPATAPAGATWTVTNSGSAAGSTNVSGGGSAGTASTFDFTTLVTP